MKNQTSREPTVDAASDPIYLDYQSTTPLDPQVLDAMMPYLVGGAGNPHSTSHLHGQAASRAVEAARVEVAALIGAQPDEIVFTSGATEADNMLIRGAASRGREGGRNAIVTCVTEHQAVLEVAKRLSCSGHDLRLVPVDASGTIDLRKLGAAVAEDVSVVSVMAANNEIGVFDDRVTDRREAGRQIPRHPIDRSLQRADLIHPKPRQFAYLLRSEVGSAGRK